ncbi:hypothetical protein WKK_00125 [Weissella koreensis KACC 15510]|nr:hypothetical protein WKK_00125 [Weissella koreensis KACC 15510]
MSITAKQMVKFLKKNGFKESRQACSHLIMIKLEMPHIPVPIHLWNLKPGTERSILK